MTTLKELVDNNIPRHIKMARDYTGAGGWVHLCNQVLRRFSTEELCELAVRKEVGVEVQDGFIVSLPSDYSSQAVLFDPLYIGSDTVVAYPYSVVNGKIRLRNHFGKDDNPSVFTLSSGTVAQTYINSTDAEENQYCNNLLVFTNGTNSGNGTIVGEHEASDGALTLLPFLYDLAVSCVTSTAGYLTTMFLMLRYMARFTALTLETDTIPVSSDFENAILKGMVAEVQPIGSKERILALNEYEHEISLLSDKINTPDIESIRSRNRPMAGLDGVSDIYLGVGDDD